MVEMVHDRIAAGEAQWFQRLLYCDVESKWKNYQIITFPGQSLSKTLEEAMDLSQDRLILELNIISRFLALLITLNNVLIIVSTNKCNIYSGKGIGNNYSESFVIKIPAVAAAQLVTLRTTVRNKSIRHH
jgi:hypothetical protein